MCCVISSQKEIIQIHGQNLLLLMLSDNQEENKNKLESLILSIMDSNVNKIEPKQAK